jgi:NADH-quinone oxidoreductase subunit C
MEENQNPTPPPRRELTPEQLAKIEAARAAKAAAGGGAVSGGGKPKPKISAERAAELAAKAQAKSEAAEPPAEAAPAQASAEAPVEVAPPATPQEAFVRNVAAQLQSIFGDAVRYPTPAEAEKKGKEPFILVQGERLPEVFTYLRDTPELGFDYLSCITAIDFKTHFDVVYQVLALRRGMRELYVRVTVPDRENAILPTIYDVYHGADFQEREIYDLMGITFRGHPYMRRILTWDTFVGHPLRKDWIPPTDWRIAPE